MENSNKGFVYILTNPSFKGDIVKIGMTRKTVEERIVSLDNTSVVTPFECYASLETDKFKEIERFVHKVFSDYRIRSNREFFRIIPEKALSFLKDMCDLVDGKITEYTSSNKVSCTKDTSNTYSFKEEPILSSTASKCKSRVPCMLDGIEYDSMGKCFNGFVKKFIMDHPAYTFESLSDLLSASLGFTSCPGRKRIITKEEFDAQDSIDLRRRFSIHFPLKIQGVEFYTASLWSTKDVPGNFFDLIDLASKLGYVIKINR